MCQNGLLTTLFLRCFGYPVCVYFGYTLFRHTARHWTTVVRLVPPARRGCKARGLVCNAATGCRIHAGCCGLRCPVYWQALGCWVGTRSGGLGWAVACTGFGVAGCLAPAWSGWLGRRYRRGTAPATGYRCTGYRLVGVSVGPAVFSCFCEAVTRCFTKPFRLYARLSDFRQAVGVNALPRWFNASEGLVAGAAGAPHGVYPRPGFQTAR